MTQWPEDTRTPAERLRDAMPRLREWEERGALCHCMRCGKDIPGMGVMVFMRDGLEFQRVPGLRLCLDCGGNGANTLTEEEVHLWL